jgi:hypothetical protein
MEAVSDTIPRFRFGERVRIMQTGDMEYRGLANKHGTLRFYDEEVLDNRTGEGGNCR